MKVIKDGARPIFDIGSCKYGNSVLGELRRKFRAALCVFESADAWCY